ncbi:hypothetical protein DPMN_080643 [Dreissena polymorpha]|uniref:Uncharacterized protein n=1 Tax=Dreissena polymorpha TaxID=45954 RepID=A0A9D3YW14_DREPO|nr:hypothetical protein DPMN_080643 [Dreissena polymorpha]
MDSYHIMVEDIESNSCLVDPEEDRCQSPSWMDQMSVTGYGPMPPSVSLLSVPVECYRQPHHVCLSR